MLGGMHHHVMHSLHSRPILYLAVAYHWSISSLPSMIMEAYTHEGGKSNILMPHPLGHYVSFVGPSTSPLLYDHKPKPIGGQLEQSLYWPYQHWWNCRYLDISKPKLPGSKETIYLLHTSHTPSIHFIVGISNCTYPNIDTCRWWRQYVTSSIDLLLHTNTSLLASLSGAPTHDP